MKKVLIAVLLLATPVGAEEQPGVPLPLERDAVIVGWDPEYNPDLETLERGTVCTLDLRKLDAFPMGKQFVIRRVTKEEKGLCPRGSIVLPLKK